MLILAAVGVALTAWPCGWLHAGMTPAEQARRDLVVAHVGPAAVTLGELEDRLAAVPRFQLRAFGDTPDAIRRKFLDQIILPEILYSLAAEKLHLADQMPTSNKVLRTLGGADTRMMIQRLRPAGAISIDEIRRYYDANRSKYDTPERMYVYRILCPTRKAAEDVLDLALKEKTLEVWTKLAHDMSMDKATSMRGGNLGYLTPDGTSSEAGLMVDPAIVKAAASVKDGEIVPTPVVEKTGPVSTAFAVVWRRGTVAANHKSVEEAAPQIREAIWKEEADKVASAHLQELRMAHLSELNESLLNGIDITAAEADVVTRRRPGEVPPLSHARGLPHTQN